MSTSICDDEMKTSDENESISSRANSSVIGLSRGQAKHSPHTSSRRKLSRYAASAERLEGLTRAGECRLLLMSTLPSGDQ